MRKLPILRLLALLLTLQCLLVSCLPTDLLTPAITTQENAATVGPNSFADLSSLPEYNGSPFVALNGNLPQFSTEDYTVTSYEFYSDLDALGRCGVAMACIGIDLMPTEDRESIGSVKPSGWQSVKYDIVDGKYLYNRCHLIGFQLSGENANEKNLITGTRYMNVDGMLPFENMIADYVKETKNHVLFRVTPLFVGDELVARGVQMEAWSVEDEGDGICFNVFVYNAQPGITINYATGESRLTTGEGAWTTPAAGEVRTYILNTNTKKFHSPTCSSVTDMSESNKATYEGAREDLIADGYEACSRCKP
ncbi:MAG: DNA/RNA non-specific endonuclease [Clostridia bacterium]|nr:DNA/RNA non-specific endonuclease [Clostridia bacterium]